jgi:hypothetical protein
MFASVGRGRFTTVLAVIAGVVCATWVGQPGASGATAPPGTDPPWTDPVARYVVIGDEPPRVCVHDDGAFVTRVERRVSYVRNGRQTLIGGLTRDMEGVVIHANTASDVISLDEDSRVTGLDGPSSENFAIFHDEGIHAGVASVHLRADIAAVRDLGWLGILEDSESDVDVTVRDCDFVISIISTFVLDGPAELTFGTAIVAVPLTRSDDGEYRQSVDVGWYSWASGVGDCNGTLGARHSEAAIFGHLDGGGVLHLQVKYEPFHVQLSANCGGFQTDVTPSTLELDVDSHGDSGSVDHSLSSPLGGIPGASSWVLIQTDDVP